MGEASRPGCALAIALACGVVLILSAIAAGAVFLRMGQAIVHLETSFVRKSLARAPADQGTLKRVEMVLDEYRRAALAAGLGPIEWWQAGRTFELSPAVAVLESRIILADQRQVAGIEPPELERGRDAWTRVVRGLAEGKIAPKDFRLLLARAGGGPEPDEETPIHIEMFALSPDFLRKLLDEAVKLADERAVAGGPFEPDLPEITKRDLLESLKRG